MANSVTLKGNPISIGGNFPSKGQNAANFELANAKRETVTLDSYAGKRKILNIFPSIDTGVCAASARRFNEAATDLENTVVINVSKDLPFALGRFCAASATSSDQSITVSTPPENTRFYAI